MWSTSARPPRETPSTWARSSEASYSGLATPPSRRSTAPVARRLRRGTCCSLMASSALERREPGREVCLDGRLQHGTEGAVEHLVEVVGLVAGAVVGDPVLGVVVGPDPLGAVDRAHLAATGVARLGVGGLLGGLQEARAQDAERLLLVLQLALLVLAADDDAGRQVGDAHRRVGGVDALPAGAGAAEDVDAQVVLVDGHVDLLGLGHDEDAGRAGVYAALALGDRDALDPV